MKVWLLASVKVIFTKSVCDFREAGCPHGNTDDSVPIMWPIEDLFTEVDGE